MADAATGRAARHPSAKQKGQGPGSPDLAGKPAKAVKQKPELKAITDTITDRALPKSAPEHDEPQPAPADDEPAALDETEIVAGLAPDGPDGDLDPAIAADLEDAVGEGELEAELAVVPDDEADEEEEDGPPVSNRVAPRHARPYARRAQPADRACSHAGQGGDLPRG